MMNLQRRLELERKVPADIQVMIGSQWWCLRRRTVEAVLDFIRERPTCALLPHHLDPGRDVLPDAGAPPGARPRDRQRTLTFKMFSDYGMPVTFYNDQYDLLISQDYLFARKISPEARVLKERLGALWAGARISPSATRARSSMRS
jgi:hypothetical protein